MKSPKNYLILLLALTTVTGGATAWRQYQELIKLRASTLSSGERADWQKRLWDAEKRRREAEAALADLHAKGADGRDGTDEDGQPLPADATGPRWRRGPGGGGLAGGFLAMMEKPEIQKLMAQQQRGVLDSHFAPLFKSLNLSPEQLDKFKNLLVERQTAMADVIAAAHQQGIDPRSDPQEFRKLVADTQAEIDGNIKATLGDAGFAQYQQYQQTLPQRNVVTQLEQSLSYTSTPLSAAQSEQLVQILASNNPTPANGTNNRANVMAGFGIGGPGPMAPISDTAITQSQSVLAAPQVQALQQLQQTQQAQQQLAQAMRSQFGNRVTPARSIVSPPAATPAPKPGG